MKLYLFSILVLVLGFFSALAFASGEQKVSGLIESTKITEKHIGVICLETVFNIQDVVGVVVSGKLDHRSQLFRRAKFSNSNNQDYSNLVFTYKKTASRSDCQFTIVDA